MKNWIQVKILFLSFTLYNCSSFTSPLKKLDGKWTTGGSIDEYHSWYLEYRFKGNSYELAGYPPLSETGIMKLKETRGDSMLVEFIVKKSSPQFGDHQEWIYIEDNKFFMGGKTFTRSQLGKGN